MCDYTLETQTITEAVTRQMNHVNEGWSKQAENSLQQSQSTLSNDSQIPVADETEQKQQVEQSRTRLKQRNIHLLSPRSVLALFGSNPKFIQILDHNFQRDKHFNKNLPLTRFNDCEFIKHQQIYDKHQYVILDNGNTIYPKQIIKHETKNKYYWLSRLEEKSPEWVLNYEQQDAKEFVRKLKEKDYTKWYSQIWFEVIPLQQNDNNGNFIVDGNKDWIRVYKETPFKLFSSRFKIWAKNEETNEYSQISYPRLRKQIPEMKANKPLVVVNLTMDGWTYSKFTHKKTETTVNSMYWSIMNIPGYLTFKQKFARAISNCPGSIDKYQWLKFSMREWKDIATQGTTTIIQGQVSNMKGIVSFCVADMALQTTLQRKRGCSEKSICDGRFYKGCNDGTKFIQNMWSSTNSINGLTLFRNWRLVHHVIPNSANPKYTEYQDQMGIGIGMSTASTDAWDEWEIDPIPKVVTALHHTTVLKGALTKMLQVSWSFIHIHNLNKYAEVNTIKMFEVILKDEYHGCNGIDCWTINRVENLFATNNIQKCWSKYTQTCLVFMSLFDHVEETKLWCQMACFFMLLTNCSTKPEIQRLKKLGTKLFEKGMSKPNQCDQKQFITKQCD